MEPGMASVFSGAKGTQMGVPWATRELKAVISFFEFCSYDLEATVSKRLSRAWPGRWIENSEREGLRAFSPL